MAEKDFIGFTFDNIHSDDLGILRVSDGDRYKENLQPEIKDLTAEVPGMDGEYYFGSTYGNKEFDIDIAYDSLTETQFRTLRRLFSGKKIHELIFDERPYKKYLVKLANPIELSYACFDEPKREKYSVLYPGAELPDGVRMVDDGGGHKILEKIDPWVQLEGTQRMYKGDGTISFIAYYPFAKNAFRVLPLEKTSDKEIIEGKQYYVYIDNECQKVVEPVKENLNKYYELTVETQEWAESSGLLSPVDYNDFDEYINLGDSKYGFRIYNPGDMDTGFRLYLDGTFLQGKSTIILKYRVNSQDETPDEFKINVPKLKGEGNEKDKGILIDTNSRLIVGVLGESTWKKGIAPTYTTSPYIYNDCIDSGYFFKFITNCDMEGDNKLQSTLEIESTPVEGANVTDTVKDPEIFYDYLYF